VSSTFEIIFAGLVDFAALELDVIDRELLLRDQRVQIEAERADVLRQLFGGLFERDENAGVAELRGAANEKFHRQQRLAAACGATDQRRPALRQPALRHFIQTINACERLGQLLARVGNHRFGCIHGRCSIAENCSDTQKSAAAFTNVLTV
jgi:hypothetical protein